MDLREVGWRVAQSATAVAERAGFRRAEVEPKTRSASGRPWIDKLPSDLDPRPYRAAADRLLGGTWDIFELSAPLGFPPQWNKDPKTGIVAPLSFGKNINYRDSRIVGDIKYLWEPSRHSAVVTLAQAWHLTHDERYARAVRTLLSSWIGQCPYLQGVHWTSSLELAIRLINWAFAWTLLGGDSAPVFSGTDGERFRAAWETAIYQHVHFIAGHLSWHSSANNHLLGELLGLYIAGLQWPFWQKSRDLAARAERLLEEQTSSQVTNDGCNREQAFWYHHEVIDMMTLALLYGEQNGRPLSRAFRQRTEQMLEFIASMMNASSEPPAIGDSDDARIISLDPTSPNVYRTQLATGAVMFDRGDFRTAGGLADTTRWLLGDDSAARYSALPHEIRPQRRTYQSAGYFVLGDRFATPSEIKVVADAGPLGYLSIAAHGHADALALWLSVAGKWVLTDVGTFTYHTDLKWRQYFRGTRAHNTVTVDDVDQSVSGGAFMWLRHAHARCEEYSSSPDSDVFVGSHDGYLRLRDPVLHRRTVRFDKAASRLVVEDRLECQGDHEVQLNWHLAEDLTPSLVGSTVRVDVNGATVWFRCSEGLDVRIARGEEDPPLGWTSSRLGHKVASAVIACRGRIQRTTTFVTTIDISMNSESV